MHCLGWPCVEFGTHCTQQHRFLGCKSGLSMFPWRFLFLFLFVLLESSIIDSRLTMVAKGS
jgi:hypothetical protein